MLRTDRNISSISVVAFVDRQHQQIQMEFPANRTKQTNEFQQNLREQCGGNGQFGDRWTYFNFYCKFVNTFCGLPTMQYIFV